MAEKKGQSLEEQSLEEIFSDLEQTIKEMEDGEISLEESFSLYQQGVLQLKNCGTILDEVERDAPIIIIPLASRSFGFVCKVFVASSTFLI